MEEDVHGSMVLFILIFESLRVIALVALVALLVVPLLLFFGSRWRGEKSGDQDPQSGFKFVVCVFGSAAFQMTTISIFVLLCTEIIEMPSDFKDLIYRTSGALLIPSIVIGVIHYRLFRKSNYRDFPSVLKMFVGYNLIIFGTLGFAGFVLLVQAILMKGSSGEIGKIAGTMATVFGTVWLTLYKVLGAHSRNASGHFSRTEPDVAIGQPNRPTAT